MTPPTPLDSQIESSRTPCSHCGAETSLSELGYCCVCQRELTILQFLTENKPVYLLTSDLNHHQVLAIKKESDSSYTCWVPSFSFPLKLVQLSDFHLSIPSLVTAGIAKANDAILRFNTLLKQTL